MLKKFFKTGLKAFNYTKSYKQFSGRDNLINCFTDEIKHEEQEYKPISEEEKKVFFKNSGFEFIESKTASKMELKKTAGDFNINVVYHARAPMPSQEEDKQQQQPQDPNNPESGNMTDFSVIIQKTGKNSGFLVDAMVVDGQININHIFISENIQDFYSKFSNGKQDPDAYNGPDFSTLDESLQNSFHEFLNELGLNDEAAAFIEVTSLDKDQYLYLNWLKTCKNNLI